ncbi:alpha/beta hydrolase [Candidatus Pelagibacter sp.]|nr:alpha/beta hydrolase [Candidatus Pelagibacter sp.]
MKDIYIGDTGKGFPLVLVHGFLGSSEMWKPQIEFFKSNYRVITPDLPGFGNSNNAQSCDSIKLMAQMMNNFLKEKRLENFFLLGHSMGGMIVQEMTKFLSDKITKLILYGTGPIGNIPGRFETIDQSREKLKKQGLKITSKEIAKTWFVKGDNSKYFDLCTHAGNLTSLKAADDALIAMKNWNGLDNLKTIKNDTLIIWGDQDMAYKYDQIKILSENIKNSNLKIFKGCSHNVHLEKPDEFNKCISEYFKD